MGGIDGTGKTYNHKKSKMKFVRLLNSQTCNWIFMFRAVSSTINVEKLLQEFNLLFFLFIQKVLIVSVLVQFIVTEFSTFVYYFTFDYCYRIILNCCLVVVCCCFFFGILQFKLLVILVHSSRLRLNGTLHLFLYIISRGR